jgi:formate hydrogenlyase subunit 6/NADH:ubiquinone oxidoreductase subunit I
MAFKITDGCVMCGVCAGACPAGAISQGKDKYEIDASSCISCGSCAGTCPTGSIEED